MVMLAAGLVILFPTLVNYVIWKRDYEYWKEALAEYNAKPHFCILDKCDIRPSVPAYDKRVEYGRDETRYAI
jgi:hypothetical protein